MKPQAGDIVFVRGNSLISKLIRLFDKGRFSHVAIFVSETHIIEAEYNTKVRIVPFSYKDYEIVHLNLARYEQSHIKRLARRFIGKQYDYVQIFRLLIELRFGLKLFSRNTPKQVVCSELVGYFLEELGKVDKGTANLAPNQLYDLLKLKY